MRVRVLLRLLWLVVLVGIKILHMQLLRDECAPHRACGTCRCRGYGHGGRPPISRQHDVRIMNKKKAHQYYLIIIITAVSMRVRVERKHTNQIHAESKRRYEQKALCLDLLRLEEPLDALHEDEEGDKHQKDGINEA